MLLSTIKIKYIVSTYLNYYLKIVLLKFIRTFAVTKIPYEADNISFAT